MIFSRLGTAVTHPASAFFILFCFLAISQPADLHASRQHPGSREPVFSSETELWQAAGQALANNDQERAAVLFCQFQKQYRQSARAEEALWQAARLHQELALGREDADWEVVRDLYRLFVAEYPESERFQEAYLRLGLAHYRMNFHREALIYLNLFLERFPQSPWRFEARFWQGRSLQTIGRMAEAEKNYQELVAGGDPYFRLRALEALGDLYSATERFQAALEQYHNLLKELVPHSPEYLEVIRRMGLAEGWLGHDIASRDHLYRYLNVVEESPHAAEVFFELGESYWRSREVETAGELYGRALERGEPQSRPVVLSRFRQALYQSLRENHPPSWQRKQGDSTAAGDRPYEAVVDAYGREPIAQEARYALLQRLMIREELDQAFLLAKTYLNHLETGAGHRKEVESILGRLLLERVRSLLEAQEYRQVIELYQRENRHMAAYDQGSLYLLVGQAMESLSLYDQASVIYRRALEREVSPAEKVDLYYRRARLYLDRNEQALAEQLLGFLRGVYPDPPEAGEILYLSGRLREMQGRDEEAAAFYAGGCKITEGEIIVAACLARVRLLLHLGRVEEAAGVLSGYGQQGLLEPIDMQHLQGELGDAWRHQRLLVRAAAAYAMGVGENMPQDNERAQTIHLRLGEVCMALGRISQAGYHFEQALAGPDPLLKKSAERGLGQIRIEQGVAEIHQPLIP